MWIFEGRVFQVVEIENVKIFRQKYGQQRKNEVSMVGVEWIKWQEDDDEFLEVIGLDYEMLRILVFFLR